MPIVENEMSYAMKLKSDIFRQLRIPNQSIHRYVSGSYFELVITTQFNSLLFDMPDFVIILF